MHGSPPSRRACWLSEGEAVRLGAGVGRGRKEAEAGQGGGGGGGGSAVPVGYIEISNGSAVFKSIRDPLVDVLVPLAALLAGFATPRMMRRLLRRG